MAKKKLNNLVTNQISLFDEFYNTQITSNGKSDTNNTETTIPNGITTIGGESGSNSIDSGTRSTTGGAGGDGQNSRGYVEIDGSTETGNIPINEEEQNSGAVLNPTGGPALFQGENDGRGGNTNTRSSGDFHEGIDGGNRSGLIAGNYKIDEAIFNANHKVFNKKRKYEANTAAIVLLTILIKEKRKATLEEQHVLANYVGFGGLKEILLNPLKDQEWNTAADTELRGHVTTLNIAIKELSTVLDEDLLSSSQNSILSAFYTPTDVIKGIYHVINNMGFKQGNILEPSAGIGNFIGFMPEAMAAKSKITAIELDRISGTILGHLYPGVNVFNQGFQVSPLPEKGFDLQISNVPFGSMQVFDRSLHTNKNPKFSEASKNIHNYYFAKSLLLAKDNGVIAFITSRYTLDSNDNKVVRELIAEQAEFLGAIRLGDNAFKANAGTQVVTDIIFLRKFAFGEVKKQKFNFTNTQTIDFTDANNISGQLNYNEYFHENPQHLLGTVEFGGLYNNDSFNLKGNNNLSYFDLISTIGDNLFPAPIIKEIQAIEAVPTKFLEANIIIPGKFESIGNLVKLDNGVVGRISSQYYINEELENRVKEQYPNINTDKFRSGNYNEYDIAALQIMGFSLSNLVSRVVTPVRISKVDQRKVENYLSIRKSLKSVVFYESNGYDDRFINEERTKLKSEYLRFVRQFGNLNNPVNLGFRKHDSVDAYLVLSLEKVDTQTRKLVPADILEKRTIKPLVKIEKATSLIDAINITIDEYGYANTNRISALLDKTFDDIFAEQDHLNPQLFLNPTPIANEDQYLIRAEYLSGEVVQKLRSAKNALVNVPSMEMNIAALESVQPLRIEAADIYAPMNASWVPKKMVIEFVQHLVKIEHVTIAYSKVNSESTLKIHGYSKEIQNFSSKRKNAEWVINLAVNGLEPVVKHTVDGKQVTDAEDTVMAREIYNKVIVRWDEWKYKTPERRLELSTIYNDNYNTTMLRDYAGSGQHIELPGLIGFQPRPHQKDAIFRFTQTMGGIADHMVGAGKTLIQACTAMELKRLGRVNKPCIIGLKSQVPQFYKEFKAAYPLANVLFPSEKDFTKENRPRLLNSIATNDWDCIILSHEQFGQIEQPAEIQIDLIKELMKNIHDEIDLCEDKKGKISLQKRFDSSLKKIEELLTIEKDKNVLNFKELGIDFLIVDECQEFKNLEFTTRQSNIRGLGNQKGSKRAFNMLVACRFMQKHHNGDRGVLFCSGTPISNSMAELYLLFKYLTPSVLAKQKFTNFDLWAANYASSFADLEYSLGKFKSIVRFREFVNLPELVGAYRTIADVRNNQNLQLDKPVGIHELFKVEPNATQLLLIKKLMAFIETKGNSYKDELGLTGGYDDEKQMNPTYGLLATNFAKKVSLDPRLINRNLEGGSKIPAIVLNVAKVFEESTSYKGTQLIFCDIGTPKSQNNVENLFNYLEEIETPIAEIVAIFGESAIEEGKFDNTQKTLEKMATNLQLSDEECRMILTEANQAQNFCVYDEIKLKLIKEGVPSNQIKFIHDYKTRFQKEELYVAMNAGDIRILIGSTRKMGTGLNVQQRICNLIHADVCWKPSDMEQRNGRGERQGNLVAKNFLLNKLPIKYFATNRTLDASMYNVVNLKAKFIAQLKVENSSARTMKDIGEETLDMGAFSAEISGDPIHKEKASLNKDVTNLRLLKSSYQNKAYQIEDNIKSATRLIPFYEGKIAGLIETLPLMDKIPTTFEPMKSMVRSENDIFDNPTNYANLGKAIHAITEQPGYIATEKPLNFILKVNDAVGNPIQLQVEVPMKEVPDFRLVVENVAYSKLPEAGKALLSHVDFLKETMPGYFNRKVAELWGFSIVVSTTNDFVGNINRSIVAPNGTIIGVDRHLPMGEIAAVLQIKDPILSIPEEIKALSLKLDVTKESLEGYKLQKNEGFPYEKELQTKAARLSEVDNLIVEMIKNESKKENDLGDDSDDDLDNDLDNDITPEIKPIKPKL